MVLSGFKTELWKANYKSFKNLLENSRDFDFRSGKYILKKISRINKKVKIHALSILIFFKKKSYFKFKDALIKM